MNTKKRNIYDDLVIEDAPNKETSHGVRYHASLIIVNLKKAYHSIRRKKFLKILKILKERNSPKDILIKAIVGQSINQVRITRLRSSN